MEIDKLLLDYKNGMISIEEVKKKISLAWIETTNRHIIDINRNNRIGIPEIIYAEKKPLDTVIEIADKMLEEHTTVLVSRSSYNSELSDYYRNKCGVICGERVIVLGKTPDPSFKILVISGGASDRPVVEEAALTLKALGAEPLVFEDRGIAHPSRVLGCIKEGIEQNCLACIIVAGMEASLATFAGSLLPMPVIGVPTSIGYGYKSGETALISMLASCTPNLAVVNVDGGIRAAIISYMIGVKRC